MPSPKAYKFSRSRSALGFDNGLIVRADGFAGNVYWLAKEAGAVEPVIPARIEGAIKDTTGDGPRQIVHQARRAYRLSGPVEVGKIEPSPYNAGAHMRRLTDSLGNAWPFAVNANFAEHIERCWPWGSWRVLANGQLLRVEWNSGRTVLRAVCMSIRVAPERKGRRMIPAAVSTSESDLSCEVDARGRGA